MTYAEMIHQAAANCVTTYENEGSAAEEAYRAERVQAIHNTSGKARITVEDDILERVEELI